MNGFFAGWKPQPAPEGVDTDYTPVSPDTPLPGWSLVVCGGDSLPEAVVHAKLDLFTQRVTGSHRITVVSPPDSETVAVWCRARRLGHQVEHEHASLYGRFGAARQAMRLVGTADAVVIFGSVARWWRVQRYAEDAGVPVRVVPGRTGEMKYPAGAAAG